METTTTSRKLQGAQALLATAMGKFAGGALSLRDICRILARELNKDPSCGGVIQELLGREVSAKRLTTKDYEELIAGIDAALSENIPTEPSSDAPAEPGVYKFDDEGTLVPSADDVLSAAPVEAYDSVEAPTKSSDEKAPEIGVGYELRGRFRLDKEIASGSMGIVYRATDLLKLEADARDPSVAIKLIRTDFTNHRNALKSFQNEIANTQHLSHPNIIHLFELDRDGDHYFITMEWLEGESLDALLDRSKGSALPPTQTYAIIEQLCDALVYAHEQDVIHADIKPGNVFLVKTGELKLIDWGIAVVDATLSDDKEDAGGLTVALTPAYASCERLEKSAPTTQDDLYSLACMIYRLLAGRRVFGAMNALEAEKAGVEPVPIGSMDEVRWTALRRALSFRRHHRQETIREFASQFGQRRTPRELEADEALHAETKTLEKLPEDASAKADKPVYKPREAPSLFPAGIAPESRPPATLAGSLHQSDGTVELSSLTGEPSANHPGDVESPNGAQSPSIDKTEKLSALEMSVAANDTVRLQSIDKTVEIHALGSEAKAGKEDEAPSVDTVRIEQMPAPINIFDGDGSGFMPVDDPALELTEQPKQQAKQPPKQQAKQQPKQQAKQQPKQQAKPPAKQAETATVARQTDKIAPQLRGGAEGQAAEASAALPAQLVAARRAKPALVIGGLLGIIVVMIGAGWMLSISELPPVSGEANSRERSGTIQSSNILRPATGPTEPSVAAPVVVDLTAPVPTSAPGAAEQADFSAPALTAPVSGAADDTDLAAPAPFEQNSESQQLEETATAQAQKASVPVVAETVDLSKPLSNPAPSAQPISKPVAAAVDDFVAEPVDVPMIESESPLSTTDKGALSEPLTAPVVNEPSTLSENVADPVPAPKPVSAPVPVPAGSSEKFIGFRNKAEIALAEDRLLQPEKDSVAYWLDQMRADGGDAVAIILMESKLIKAFIDHAEDAYIAGDMDEANRYVELAARDGADEDELAPLRASIAKVERVEQARAEKIMSGLQQGSAQAGSANRVQAVDARFDSLPLSTFEFIDYVEPVYPSKGLNRPLSGWVDVVFTVGEDGKPLNIQVIGSDLPARFKAPSIDAIKRWRFKPYTPDGVPLVANSAVRLRYEKQP